MSNEKFGTNPLDWLVSETLAGASEPAISDERFTPRFGMEEFFKSHGVTAIPIFFNQKNRSFRLRLGDKYLDIPSNWSQFAKLNEALITNHQEYIVIDRANDRDFLCEIFSSIIGRCDNFALIHTEHEMFLVFALEGIESFLKNVFKLLQREANHIKHAG